MVPMLFVLTGRMAVLEANMTIGIRNFLLLALLFATLAPSAIYGYWSYNQSVRREFREVNDRHLLIARNLGGALERYYDDLVAAFDSISASMLDRRDVPKLDQLMRRLNIVCILVVDKKDSTIIARAETDVTLGHDKLPEAVMSAAMAIATLNRTVVSTVMAGPNGQNEILAVHDYGDAVAVARIGTGYFVKVGKAVAFGKNGHAAIVDRDGNVMAHPLPSWVAERRNIAGVSAVRRMMAGETGIEQFYSPAMKGDMIAGLTSVGGPGWGVMVPQPVSELYDRAFENNISILAVLAAGVSLTIAIVFILTRAFVRPLEMMSQRLAQNAANGQLSAISPGASRFRIKEFADYLASYNHMVNEVNNTHLEVARLAYFDRLTGLPNRERFTRMAARTISEDLTAGEGGALLFIDIDNFKEINDVNGHDTGDEFLLDCSRKLKLAVGINAGAARKETPEPIIARIGGDEFVILVPHLTEDGKIVSLLSTLKESLSQPPEALPTVDRCSASIGCARYPGDASTLDDLMKLADIAMFQAKKSGKNNFEIYTPQIGTQTKAEIRRDVAHAIEAGELFLEYQPEINAGDWSLNCVEALVRWNHPERGRLAPDRWLPAIAESPVIRKLGEWVIIRAIEDNLVWRSQGLHYKMAVNIASQHLVGAGFAEWLEATVRKHGFPASDLEIEVTEDALLSAEDRARAVVRRLTAIGFSVAVDDFGKGHSNIARLSKLPVNKIKIDRSIIAGAQDDPRILSILRWIIAMSHELKCKTVVEGVETLAQCELVTDLGADLLQGFHFSRSLSPQEMTGWVGPKKPEAPAGAGARGQRPLGATQDLAAS